jgi:peptidoglycan/xylan/chitin deacetylase (PgdA/CDA1 family)
VGFTLAHGLAFSPIDLRAAPLDELLAPHEPLPAVSGAGGGEACWLQGAGWRVWARPRAGAEPPGEEIATFVLEDGRRLSARLDPATGRVSVPFDLSEAYENLVLERWGGGRALPGLSPAQFDLFYRVKRFVPRRAQLAARRALMRRQARSPFPSWPVDETVASLLRFRVRCALRASGRESLTFRWFWPHGRPAALVLTHDVESAEGLRLAVELADVEEELGLRSSFNVVASWYPLDRGILDELAGRGFELGVHGVHHDRSLFSSRAEFERQRPLLASFAAELGAVGFRSPAVHRVPEWLADLPFEYDCTVPHSDPYEPQPGGCCTVWPFRIGEVVELPWTLTQDHTLFTLLRRRSIDLWRAEVERVEALHGLVQCPTHPDPGYLGDREKRALYREFLAYVAERGLWHALPRDVARWWRRRADPAAEGEFAIGVAALDDGDVSFGPLQAA